MSSRPSARRPWPAVDAGALNRLYALLLASGRKDAEGQGLSPRSVRYVHTILHRAFKDAVRWGRLVRNPCDAADPPRVAAASSPESVVWSPQELAGFLEHVRGDRLHATYVLLATTGARRGEVLGVRWQDLDLAAGTFAIRQTVINVNHEVLIGTPKTAQSRRTVTLDPFTVASLREHRQRQLVERLQMGAGRADLDLVFCRPDGGPLHPERFSRSFADHIRRAGLPKIRLHDLRHGWATMALTAGVHPKVVQERLGHSNVTITLSIYSHVTGALHSDAADKVAGLVFGR